MSERIQANINLNFIRGGYAVVGRPGTDNEFWCIYDRINEENKFYLPMKGRGELYIGGTHYPLSRGRWFFIGAGETRSYHTADGNELEKWFLHFYGAADNKTIKEAFDLPDYVDLTEEEYEKALKLMQRVRLTDMQAPADLYELFENKSKVFDILSYYIELAKKKDMHYVHNRGEDADIRRKILEAAGAADINYVDTKMLAQALGMNEKYFFRYFKKQFMITPGQMAFKRRLERSKELLVYTKSSVGEIAKECGFESESYFCEFFKKHINISPLQYRIDYLLKVES